MLSGQKVKSDFFPENMYINYKECYFVELFISFLNVDAFVNFIWLGMFRRASVNQRTKSYCS